MGLEALYPWRASSQPGDGHVIYPYLLKDLAVPGPDQALDNAPPPPSGTSPLRTTAALLPPRKRCSLLLPQSRGAASHEPRSPARSSAIQGLLKHLEVRPPAAVNTRTQSQREGRGTGRPASSFLFPQWIEAQSGRHKTTRAASTNHSLNAAPRGLENGVHLSRRGEGGWKKDNSQKAVCADRRGVEPTGKTCAPSRQQRSSWHGSDRGAAIGRALYGCGNRRLTGMSQDAACGASTAVRERCLAGRVSREECGALSWIEWHRALPIVER
jgi:hypothetical protein